MKKTQETHFYITFRGVDYRVELLTPERYKKKHKDHDDSSEAFFERGKKLVAFRTDHLKKNVVVHELSHLYFSQHYFASAEPSVNTIDEIIAETNEDHLFDFIKLINYTYRTLKEYRKKIK